MNKFHAITLAVSAQSRKRDEVARQLAAARYDLDSAQAQLGQLRTYAADTGRAWSTSGHQHGVAGLQHQARFMDKLQGAIDFQGGVVASLGRRAAELETQLTAASQRIQALERVLATHQREERHRAQRIEQRLTDEMASLRHVHLRSAHHAC